jgi:uncharacterized membrane protein HdeD (DUF308 family)
MSTDGAASTALDEIDLAVAKSWPVVMFVGLVTIVIGIMVVAWPDETLKVLSVLFGIQLLVFGLFRLISAFSSDSSDSLAPGLVGFIGVIGMMAGVVVLRNPFETVAVLATVLGIVWIVGGSIDLITSIADRRLDNRGMTAFSAVVTVIAGIVVVSWPAPTLAVIAWIAGIYLITFGVLFCLGAFRLRQLEG